MTITPLPDATVRLLGSTQALTTPTSLVKELIDNSLDARASSVEVVISSNTLDRIEVRDNGHGIPQEDFDSLGKRGHTSKLRSFEELKSIGGISLGFRGEALFSAVQLGNVYVTSRSDGELVATQAKLKSLGGVDTQAPTSHPIGTTIYVTDFLSSIPVRKQTCLKEAPKTQAKIKELLRAYSLARPHIKFNLKVIKSLKGSWSYSPHKNNGINEAVSQIISRELIKQCIRKSVAFTEEQCLRWNDNNQLAAKITEDSTSFENTFIVEMFLPKPTADFSKVSFGQYISVDARPVSHDKGTMKKIVTIFKHYIMNCLSEASKKPKNPFLYLSIQCPVESYDPNIEPAKDDVIFDKEHIILENIENTFREIYGAREAREAFSNNSRGITDGDIQDNFELLLSRKVAKPKITKQNLSVVEIDHQPSATSSNKITKSLDAELLQNSIHPSPEENSNNQETIRQNMMISAFNDKPDRMEIVEMPVISSKKFVNTPISSKKDYEIDMLNSWLTPKAEIQKIKIREINNNDNRNSSSESEKSQEEFLPTPQPSSDPVVADAEVDSTMDVEEGSLEMRRNTQSPRISSQLSTRVPNIRSNLSEERLLATDSDTEQGLFITANTANTAASSRCQGFVSARRFIDSQPSRLAVQLSRSKSQNTVNKPFVSPLRKKQGNFPESLYQTLLSGNDLLESDKKRKNTKQSKEIDPVPSRSMDYEYKKERATQCFRNSLQKSQQLHLSPDKRDGNVIALDLDTNSCHDQQVTKKTTSYPKVNTSLPDDDPRGYYIRRQKSPLFHAGRADGPKISRAKSLRLPLERIPEKQELHEHLLRLPILTEQVNRMRQLLTITDEYIQRGNDERHLTEILLNPSEKDKRDMIRMVKDLVERNRHNELFSLIDCNVIKFKSDKFIMAKS